MIYITGHRNPDLDSVCSAYAYAALKNQIDPDQEYMAVRCGHLSDSEKKILAYAKLTPPPYKKDIYPHVCDVMLDSKEKIEADAPITELAKTYDYTDPSATPIFENGEFYGLLFVDDVTSWVMNSLRDGGSISEVPKIRDIMRTQPKPLSYTARLDEAKTVTTMPKFRGVAVFDGDTYKGYLTRRCFLEAPKHKVILVDHNEPEQSIRGILTAEILEIVDHHRLDAVKTDLPIFIDSEPLGSTCTIIYQLFRRHHIVPSQDVAKAMLTGLIADTLILRSPTTTSVDVDSAAALAEICGVTVEEYGRGMFANVAGLETRDPYEAVTADFKTYEEHGVRFGIGQVEVMTMQDLPVCKDRYLTVLDEVRHENGLDWAMVMITDVLREHSILLASDFRANQHLHYVMTENNVFDMPGVMSRKKQLLPEVLHATSIR